MRLSDLILRLKRRRSALDDRPEARGRPEKKPPPIEVEPEDWRTGMVREFRELYGRDRPS